jgi:uncharacterized membrane protein YdjX (TVP38/TMEM64 family)
MLKASIVFTMITGLVFAVIMFPQREAFLNIDIHTLITPYLPQGPSGIIILFIVMSLVTAIGFPRQVAAFIAGYSLGFVNGTILITLASTIGCFITLSVSKKYLSHWSRNKYPQLYQKLQSFFIDDIFYKAFIIRILPIGSNFLTNVIAGSCQVNTKPYLLGSCLGFIPQMAIFSLAGSGIQLADNTQLSISITLFIIAFVLSIVLYLHQKRKNTACRL